MNHKIPQKRQSHNTNYKNFPKQHQIHCIQKNALTKSSDPKIKNNPLSKITKPSRQNSKQITNAQNVSSARKTKLQMNEMGKLTFSRTLRQQPLKCQEVGFPCPTWSLRTPLMQKILQRDQLTSSVQWLDLTWCKRNTLRRVGGIFVVTGRRAYVGKMSLPSPTSPTQLGLIFNNLPWGLRLL